MKKKLNVVELKEYNVFEETPGEFVQEVVNVEKHPLVFNNKALQKGKEYGILEKGLENELFNLLSTIDPNTVQAMASGGEMNIEQVVALTEALDVDHMKDIIWLAYLGGGKKNDYDLDAFKERYEPEFEEILTLYINVLTSNLQGVQNNAYKAGLEKSVARGKKGKK